MIEGTAMERLTYSAVPSRIMFQCNDFPIFAGSGETEDESRESTASLYDGAR